MRSIYISESNLTKFGNIYQISSSFLVFLSFFSFFFDTNGKSIAKGEPVHHNAEGDTQPWHQEPHTYQMKLLLV